MFQEIVLLFVFYFLTWFTKDEGRVRRSSLQFVCVVKKCGNEMLSVSEFIGETVKLRAK